MKTYEGLPLSPAQPLVFDYRGVQLLLRVTNILPIAPQAQHEAAAQQENVQTAMIMQNTVFNFIKDASAIRLQQSAKRAPTNAIVAPNFNFKDLGIGGLDDEFAHIFRRAFASRVFPPGLIAKLGIQHVKGILLYGPPGTGKTLMARQIGKMLNAKEPKIVNGPEVLSKFVGASEENIRKLFADAEREYKERGDDSELHIIIFDELDAICKQRGSGGAGSTGVGDTVVNQLLSKVLFHFDGCSSVGSVDSLCRWTALTG